MSDARLYPVRPDVLWGLIDACGAWVLEPCLSWVGSYAEGVAFAADAEGRRGVLDASGAWVAAPGALAGEPGIAPAFSEGLAPARDAQGRWGFLGPNGQWAIGPQWERVEPFSEGLAVVGRDGLCGYVERSGALTIGLRFDVAGSFAGGRALTSRYGQDGWSYVDHAGAVVIPGPYGSACAFSEERAAFLDPRTERWGYLDPSGAVAIPPVFALAGPHREGLAAVRPAGSHGNGFVDREGTLVVAPRFAEAGSFSGGLARVRDRDGWGYLDLAGRAAIAPQFLDARDFEGELARVVFSGHTPRATEGRLAGLARDDPAQPLWSSLQRAAAADHFGRGDFAWIDRTGRVVWAPFEAPAVTPVTPEQAGSSEGSASPRSAAELSARLAPGDAAREAREAAHARWLEAGPWRHTARSPLFWGLVACAVLYLYTRAHELLILPMGHELGWVALPLSLALGRALARLSHELGGPRALLGPFALATAAASAFLARKLHLPPSLLEVPLAATAAPPLLGASLGLWAGRVFAAQRRDMKPAGAKRLLGGLVALGGLSALLALALGPLPPKLLLMFAALASAVGGGPLWLVFADRDPDVAPHLTYLGFFGHRGASGDGEEARRAREEAAAARGFSGLVAAFTVVALTLLLPWALLGRLGASWY